MADHEALLARLGAKQSSDEQLNESELRECETVLINLGERYAAADDAERLAALVGESKRLLSSFSKAKSAKLLRTLLDIFARIENSEQTQITTIKECVDWARAEKRTFFRHALETRLVALYLAISSYHDALELASVLLKEQKRLDDKLVQVEVHLLESRVYHALRNIPKARSALSAARAAGNAVYLSPPIQAALDMQAGILHAEDGDFATSYSYFYEAFEGQQDPQISLRALKYMLLSKIMIGDSDSVPGIVARAKKHTGRGIDAMKAVAEAYKERSLADFERVLSEYEDELSSDPIIRAHLVALYDTMLETNLLKVIQPFSRVEVEHVARKVALGTAQVEAKLSQMILDRVFNGILDQGAGVLMVFDETKSDKTYDVALETIRHLSTVTDLLYDKAVKLRG